MSKSKGTRGLDGMIRLQKWQLNEKRRELADLENMRDDLLGRKVALEEEIVAEQKIAAGAETAFAYGSFANAAIIRRRRLEASVREIETTIEVKKDEVAEAFQELKKYEIAVRRRREQAVQEEKQKMQAEMDEISLTMYRRASNR